MTYVPSPKSMWRDDGELRQFFVYIVSNTSMTLYTGVTNNLLGRVHAHKTGEGSQFTSRYHFDRLVYFEPTISWWMRSRGRSRSKGLRARRRSH